MEAKTPQGDIGVIIGRFQTPDLHTGHLDLIDTVVKKHKKVLIFICSTPGVLVTRKNPLDYFTRMLMIQKVYPNVATCPLHDTPDDHNWSKTVDQKIAETFGNHMSAVLYGSRDAFIPHYFGRYPTVELAYSVDITGTEVREAASTEVRQCSEFRRGVVYAAHNKHPAIFPTVDIAVIKTDSELYDKQRCQIALGRKNTDPKNQWRLPGGFVDPRKDSHFQGAAKRELREEMGLDLTIDHLDYVGSCRVNDWRYRHELDQIMTTIFVAKYLWGTISPGDDLDAVNWFNLDFKMENLIVEHRPLMEMVLTHLEKE